MNKETALLFASLKFLHIVGVLVWVGGLVTLAVLNARLARVRDTAVAAQIAELGGWLGQRVLAPAAGLTLVAGLGTVWAGGISFSRPWIAWGLLAIVLSVALGATVIRRGSERLGQLLAHGPEDPRVPQLRRRIALAGGLNLLILLSAVWAMVFKPG